MTILGGPYWAGSEAVCEIWQDDTGRPVTRHDPRAVTVKYRIGDTVSDADRQRMILEYRQPVPADQPAPQITT